MAWIYEWGKDVRFVLGTRGDNPLICFGVNPSTATPTALDPTLRCVQRVAEENAEFDSFIMLNLYPYRATNPNDLPLECAPEVKLANERQIIRYLAGKPRTLWAAWGGLIDTRPYLIELLQDIVRLPGMQHCTWVSRGTCTKKGHPHHPLYVKADTPLVPFDMSIYA